jgi:outer membrane protein OmpA-like peptidoglycan-associated protein
MNAFCDGIHRCQREQTTASQSAGKNLTFGKFVQRGALIAALLVLGGCSWFEDDEPAFPPTTGGPNIAAVPDGLPGDAADADYSNQELRALLGSAPRPLPAPPAPPKAADTNAPDGTKPDASASPATDGGTASPAATTSTQPSGTPAVPAAPAATNNPNAYPDINTVPMQRPTPQTDPDMPATQTTPAPTPDTSDKPKQSSMLIPAPAAPIEGEQLLILTTAGSSPAAPTQLADQTAQSVTSSDDDMFSKPTLPPYSGYDQVQKQPQGIPAQSLYRSPYAGPTQLGQPAALDSGSVVYAGQTDGGTVQTGSQIVAAPNGQPVGLVYFGIGSTQLGGSDRQVLQQIASLQKAYGGVIRIVGHASSRTENMPMDQHHKTNADIAETRARSVALQLVRYGVRPLFVQVAGASDSQPLYPEIMPAGEAANRRAEIYLSSN